MEQPKRFVYVIRTMSHPRRFYTGLAADVRARLADHNAGNSPQTAKHRPWRLHVVMQFADPERAAAFERYLKTLSGRAFSRAHFEPGEPPSD
jgi:predicted GIY-YIG superfamily endonuclease